MNELLNRVVNVNAPAQDKEKLAGKVKGLVAADLFSARTLVYYEKVDELPDSVRLKPLAAQRAYLWTFNNWLMKTGDHAKATRAAWKALRNKIDHINAIKRRAHNKGGVDEGLIAWHAKRSIRGPQVQIVVP